MKYIIGAVLLVASIFGGYSYFTQSNGVGGGLGTIEQLGQWFFDGTYLTQNTTGRLIKLSGYGSAGYCLTTDASGVVSTTTCGAAGSSKWESLGGFLQPLIAYVNDTIRGKSFTASSTTDINSLPLITATRATTTSLTITGVANQSCIGTNAAGVVQAGTCSGSGTVYVSTTTVTTGQVAFISGSGSIGSVATGTLTTTATGTQLSATRALIGGASIFSWLPGYDAVLSASTTQWKAFYDTPSTRITAGTGLSWAGNTLTATGGGGSSTPGGSNTQLQYNNAGVFGGTANITIPDPSNLVLNYVDVQGFSATTTNDPGSFLPLRGGDGNGTGGGGWVTIKGGGGGDNAPGGQARVNGGYGGNVSGDGGDVQIQAGTAPGVGNGGNIQLIPGTGGINGQVTIGTFATTTGALLYVVGSSTLNGLTTVENAPLYIHDSTFTENNRFSSFGAFFCGFGFLTGKNSLLGGCDNDNTHWTTANVGYNSIAIGNDVIAKGDYSAVFGDTNTAIGVGSITAGNNNTNSARWTAAFGKTNTIPVTTGDYSFVSGRNNTISSAYSSTDAVAIGNGNTVGGVGSGALGQFNTLNSSNGTAPDTSWAIGDSNSISQLNAMALGWQNTATGTGSDSDSIVIGALNRSQGDGVYTIGRNGSTTANQALTVSMGPIGGRKLSNTINGSMQFGSNATSATLFISSSTANGIGLIGVNTTTPSTALTVSGTTTTTGLKIGTLSGILKATAGNIGTTLVDLASDITGILGFTNGGTATSTTPAQDQILVGNGTNYSYRRIVAGTNVTVSTSTAGQIVISSTGGGSTVYVSTTSVTTGQVAFISGPGSIGSVATGTLTTTATGLQFDNTRALFGGAAILSLTGGYGIPLTASSTQWDAAYASTTALTNSYIRNLFSNTVTGLTYTAASGVTSQTAGYSIPLTNSQLTANSSTTGNLTFWSGNQTLGNVATGTISTDANFTVTANRSTVGGATAIGLAANLTVPSSTGLVQLYASSHNPVTLSGSPNYITLVGQDIVRALINLGTHVTGVLGLANGGTGTSTTPAQDQILVGNGIDYSYRRLVGGTNVTLSTSTAGQIIINATAGGSVLWDTIGDAAANGSIGMSEYTQTLDWDTGAVTAIAADYLTMTSQNDAATDVSTQRLLVLDNKAASTNVMEVMQRITNSDALAVVTGLLVDGVGAFTTAIDLSDPDIVTALSTGLNDLSGTNWSIAGATGALTLGTPLAATSGGTAQATYSTGDTLYASAANTLSKRTIGTTGDVYSVVGGVPSWVATSTLGLSGGSAAAPTSTMVVCAAGCVYSSIQSALNAGFTNIELKAETYAGTVLIPNSDTRIRGAGMYSSIITCAATANTQCVKVATTSSLTRITLEDFGIDNTLTSQLGTGLDTSNTSNVYTNRVRITEFNLGHLHRDTNNTSFYSSFSGMVYFDNANCFATGGTQSNDNTLYNPRCRIATSTGIGFNFVDAQGWTLISPNAEPGTVIGTGLSVDGTSIGITVINPWFEGNSTGTVIAAGALNTSIKGGRITAGTVGVADSGTRTFLDSTLVSANTTDFVGGTGMSMINGRSTFASPATLIGTTSPFADTDRLILGLSSSDVNANALTINNYGAFATAPAAIKFDNTAGGFTSGTGRIYVNPGSGYTNAKMTFAVADGAKSLTDRMVIDVNGNVGIGSTSPAAKLAINANVGDTNTRLFEIGSSTASGTSTLLSVSNQGYIGQLAAPSDGIYYFLQGANMGVVNKSITGLRFTLTPSNTTLAGAFHNGIRGIVNIGASNTQNVTEANGATLGITTVAGSTGILATARGLNIETMTAGGSAVTNNYGISVANQTAGASNYGLYIEGASTYPLWVDSGLSRFDGNVAIGTTSASAQLQVMGDAIIQKIFNLSTSTATTSQLFSVFATSTTLRHSSSLSYFQDNGTRTQVGISGYYGRSDTLDTFVVSGTFRQHGWATANCPSIVGGVQIVADGTTGCEGYSFYEDAADGTLTATGGNGYTYGRLAVGATTANGSGFFANGPSAGWIRLATSTPSFEVFGRHVLASAMGTSSQVYIGYTDVASAGTAYETAPANGCYFTSSSTQANWWAVCALAGARTNTDTGIASTTAQAAAGQWYMFRIDADADGARFYMRESETAVLRQVAYITTNKPLVDLNAGVHVNKNLSTLLPSFDIAHFDLQWRKMLPLN